MDADIEDLTKELWFRQRNEGQLKWKTKDGKQIPIKDMTTQHIINAINRMTENDRQSELACELSELACEYEAYINDLD